MAEVRLYLASAESSAKPYHMKTALHEAFASKSGNLSLSLLVSLADT